MSTADVTSQAESQADARSTTTSQTLGRLSQSTLSMRNKKQMKRQANAHHSSNFHAGYVPVTEDVLHRSGIRGRKRYFLFCTIGVLLFIACANILVTACLIYLLGMSHEGVAHWETVDVATRSFFHIFGTTFATSFIFNGVPLGSKYGKDISVTSQGFPINIASFESSSSSSFSPTLSLNESIVSVLADAMLVKSNQSDGWVSLDVQTVAKSHGISNYLVESLTTRKIQNHKDVIDLYLESPLKKVKVNGSEGVDMQSMKNMEVTAKNIVVQSDNSVVIQSKRSVYLDPNLPKVNDENFRSSRVGNKICACGNGKLFFVDGSSPTACNIKKEVSLIVCK